MSVPRQPSEPLRPAAPPGASEAEEAGLRPPLAGADPPIIDDASPEDQPNPDPDEGTPPPAEPAPRRELPRLQQPARGQRALRKAEPPAPPLTAEQRLLLLDTPSDCAATFSTGEAVRKPTEPPDAVECK